MVEPEPADGSPIQPGDLGAGGQCDGEGAANATPLQPRRPVNRLRGFLQSVRQRLLRAAHEFVRPADRGLAWMAGLTVFCLICLSGRFEIARLVGDVDFEGTRYSANVLSSMFDVGDVGSAASAWKDAEVVRGPLWWFFACEVVGLGTCIAVAVLACRRWASTISRIWFVVVVGLWALQIGLQAIAIGGFTATGWMVALTVVTYGAWVMSIAFVAWFAFRALSTGGRWATLGMVAKAVGVQRFQFGVVLLLAALFVVPGPPILEQGTDVVRSWVLDGEWASALVGTLSFLSLAVVLLYLGSVRSARTSRAELKPNPCSDWWWLAAGVGLAGVVVILGQILDDRVRVDNRAALFAGGVLAAPPFLSIIAKRAVKTAPAARNDDDDDKHVRDASLFVGRVLSASVLVVLGLSVCRSLVAPLVLLDRSWVWVVVAIAVALVSCLTMAWAIGAEPPKSKSPEALKNRLHPQSLGTAAPEGSTTVLGNVPSIGLPSVLTLILGLLMFVLPLPFSRVLGLVGTVGLSLVLLTLFFMSLQIASQVLTPPFVFRAMRLRRTPVTEIVLAIALLSTFFATGSSLHAVRTGSLDSTAATEMDPRPTVDEAFKTWVGRQTDECALLPAEASDFREPDEGQPKLQRVRPLILVAAEGGGIRAARWTVQVMTELTQTDCGANSVFLASGVSGGAVGLGLMASVRPTGQGASDDLTPTEAVGRMAAQRGLSAAVGGLLTRDLFAGVLGVEINPSHVADDNTRFPDRAGLMEYEWEQQIPGFDSPFPIEADEADVPVRGWHTVFNGTSVGYECRVLIADIQLITSKKSNDCDGAANEVPGAYDLFTKHPCYLGMRTSSASMMAARFPFVTPSAVVDAACGDEHFADQIIDGGYAENSGIDTANSVLSQLMPHIRAHNHSELSTGGGGTVIVPLVVFAHNTVAVARPTTPEPPKAQPELLVPIGNAGASATLGDPVTLLAHSTVIASNWIPDTFDTPLDSDGRPMPLPEGWQQSLVHLMHDHFLQDLAVTVAPRQKPQMALPLGWSMSSATQESMDDALREYRTCTDSACTTFNSVLNSWPPADTKPAPPDEGD